MKQTTEESLRDLVDVAQRLSQYGFREHLCDMGTGFRMKKGDAEKWELEFDLPDEKERDATLLSLRLFDQQNEKFAFHALSHLAEDEGLSSGYRLEINQIRDAYFSYLNGHPVNIKPGFLEEGANPTRGEILRIVLNGALGHRRDRSKRARYEHWARDAIREAVLHQEFAKIVYALLGLIEKLSAITSDELDLQTS